VCSFCKGSARLIIGQLLCFKVRSNKYIIYNFVNFSIQFSEIKIAVFGNALL